MQDEATAYADLMATSPNYHRAARVAGRCRVLA